MTFDLPGLSTSSWKNVDDNGISFTELFRTVPSTAFKHYSKLFPCPIPCCSCNSAVGSLPEEDCQVQILILQHRRTCFFLSHLVSKLDSSHSVQKNLYRLEVWVIIYRCLACAQRLLRHLGLERVKAYKPPIRDAPGSTHVIFLGLEGNTGSHFFSLWRCFNK